MRHLVAILPLLLSAVLPTGCADEQGATSGDETPSLLSAAETGNLQRLEQLLGERNPVDARDSCHWTPLMKAAVNGHTATVHRLLQAGAQPDLTDKGGYSALMLAASNNHFAIVDLLLQHGADVNRQESTRGWTALIWSAKQGHRQTAERLLVQGADLGIRDHAGKTALDWARQIHHPELIRFLQRPANHQPAPEGEQATAG